MKYALNIGEDGRILSATFPEFADRNAVLVEQLPQGDLTDYKYADGNFLLDPLPAPAETPSQMDRIEAQLIYTAMMTGTLLEE